MTDKEKKLTKEELGEKVEKEPQTEELSEEDLDDVAGGFEATSATLLPKKVKGDTICNSNC